MQLWLHAWRKSNSETCIIWEQKTRGENKGSSNSQFSIFVLIFLMGSASFSSTSSSHVEQNRSASTAVSMGREGTCLEQTYQVTLQWNLFYVVCGPLRLLVKSDSTHNLKNNSAELLKRENLPTFNFFILSTTLVISIQPSLFTIHHKIIKTVFCESLHTESLFIVF